MTYFVAGLLHVELIVDLVLQNLQGYGIDVRGCMQAVAFHQKIPSHA